MSGAYCEQYGTSIRNKVIEHFLENDGTHISAGQMAKEIKISRQKAYEELNALIKIKYVKKFKIHSGTQLYALNRENPRVKLLEKNFLECLQLIGKKHVKEDIHEILLAQNKLLKQIEINHKKIVQMIK